MKIYNPQAPIPAVAITLATGITNAQPILFTTQFGAKGEDGRELEWVIRDVKVTLVRDWATSQASITLTINQKGSPNQMLPPLPCVDKWRGGAYPHLTIDDEIRIYAGYIQDRSTIINGDMLDEVPIDICPTEFYMSGPGKCIFGEAVPSNDCNRPLAPIFWGFIDSVNFTGTSQGGEQITLSCRDRMRVLTDTKIIAIPHLEGVKGGVSSTGDRATILLETAKAAVGYTLGAESEKSQCWKDIHKGYTYTAFDLEGVDKCTTPLEDPPLWMRLATFYPMRLDAAPRFHIWAQRPPLLKDHNAAVFQVLDKNPMEIIQYLADTEERVTDFYASHVNGDFVFGPRVLDTSGFYDPMRMYRTYFYKSWPNETPPANQMIMKIRSVSSSLGTFNQFVVAEGQSGTSGTFIDAIQVMLNTQLPIHEGRTPGPPCRMQIIYDDSISSYSNPAGGALLAALNQARTWSRDVTGVEITVLGDPTLYPGEAIRVYNSVLHQWGIPIDPGTDISQAQREEIRARQTELGKKAGEIGKSPLDETSVSEANALSKCLIPTSPNEILPVYKIRNIQHVIKAQGADAGWITRIRAVGDYS